MAINGGLPLVGMAMGSALAMAAFKSAAEHLSSAGEGVWEKMAGSELGQKAVALTRKMGGWAVPAGMAAMAAAGAVATQAMGHDSTSVAYGLAAIGTGVLAPLAMGKAMEKADDAANLAQLRAARQAARQPDGGEPVPATSRGMKMG